MSQIAFYPRDIQFNTKGVVLTSKVTGQILDIYPIMIELNIFENILRNSIEAELIIQDTLSLQSVFPIVGEEEVYMEFRSPTGTDDREYSRYNFRVVGVKNLSRGSTDRSEFIRLSLVSKEAVTDQQVNIQESFKPIPGEEKSGLISEWVKIILSERLSSTKPLDIEETRSPQQFVIPNMSPFETIRMLMKYADSAEFPEISDYLFWEDKDGFHFKTLQKIINDKMVGAAPVVTTAATGAPVSRRDGLRDFQNATVPSRNSTLGWADEIYYDSQQNLPRKISEAAKSPYTGTQLDYLKIIKYEFNTVIDVDAMLNQGFYDNKVQAVNPSDMEFTENVFQYHSDHTKFKVLDKYKKWNPISPASSEQANKNGESFVRLIYHNPYHTNGVGSIPSYPQVRKDFMHNSIASFAMLSNPILTITIPGDNTRKPGDVLEIALAEFGATDDIISENHRFFDGYYIVLAVRHVYNTVSKYVTVLELAKNNFSSRIEARQ